MSTTYHLQPRARFPLLPYVIAIVIALCVGATAGSLITRAVAERPHPVAAPSGWDAQKLQAMVCRQLAAGIGGPVHLWDRAKLQAMAGREKAEAIGLRGSPR
jgi:hypothetical protein